MTKIVFVRHGQGEHTLNPPNSLHIQDPKLTKEGVVQARRLIRELPLIESDIVITSPLRRTVETALLWSKEVKCKIIVNPLVGPRMFPQLPEGKTLPCDVLLSRKSLELEFPHLTYEANISEEIWSNGINILPEDKFKELAEAFIFWSKHQSNNRVFVVSHDGTITSYRQLITGMKLTRKAFLKETSWIEMDCCK